MRLGLSCLGWCSCLFFGFFSFFLLIKFRGDGLGLIRFKKSCDMKRSIAFGEDDDLIDKCKEEIDDGMRSFPGKGGNEEFLILLLGEERDLFFGGGCQYNIGDGQYFSLVLFSLFG